MTDIIICQMGKVASTAIYQAIKAAGENPIHTHFLGETSLHGVLRTITNPDAHPKVIVDATEQLLKAVELTRLVNGYRKHKAEEKLKFITLARNPIARYRGVVIQNFEKLIGPIKAWDPSDERLTHLFQAVFDAAEEDSFAGKPEVVRAHLSILFSPLNWFDINIKVPLGVDIYSEELNENGYQIYRTEFCELLLLKYENLQNSWPAIGRFVQIDSLRSIRRNASSDKPGYNEVMNAFAHVNIGPCKPLYTSRYCRFFGYP